MSRSSAKHKSPTGFLDMEILEELSNDMQVPLFVCVDFRAKSAFFHVILASRFTDL